MMKLPRCRHRGEQIATGRWICTSDRMVIPGRVVTSDICNRQCPYVDHDRNHHVAFARRKHHRPGDDRVGPGMPLSKFIELIADKHHGLPTGWYWWDVAQRAHRQMIRDAANRDVLPPGTLNGRGIVIAAGGTAYFSCAYVCARVLRELGCDLPIEFWHLGPDEIDRQMARLVEPLSVRCCDALRVNGQPRRLGGWELKPFAIMNSRFREVMYLDADNLPAIDPTYLFEDKQFRKHGAMFWPDLLPPIGSHGEVPAIAWDIAEIAWRDKPAFESGQLLIDKSRCWRELNLAMHLNEHSDFWYHYVYGDKDTFKLAWHKFDRRYAMTTHPANWFSPAIHQYDRDGRLVFTHACQAKRHIRAGIRIPNIPSADQAVAAAAELTASVWARAKSKPPIVATSVDARHLLGDDATWNGPISHATESWKVEGLQPDEFQLNASAIVFNGQLLMAYRLKWDRSEIWICRLDEDWKPIWNRRIEIPREYLNSLACEDPRLFVHGNRLHVAYAGVRPTESDKIVSVMYCRLTEDFRVDGNWYPEYSGRSHWEKNWSFFEFNDQLYAVYSIDPHIVLRIDAGRADRVHDVQWRPNWRGGLMRGGASPVRHGDEFYCFFHGASDAVTPRAYTLGCYTFDATPPFRPRRLTTAPLAQPNSADQPQRHQPHCVYPAGAVLQNGQWRISCGYYDHEVWVLAFDEPYIENLLKDVSPAVRACEIE